jgi:hypothetical protein
MKARKRENAGRSDWIAFHQEPHSDSGCPNRSGSGAPDEPHLIRRIGALNRGNIITPRQIESACSARLAHTGHNRHSNDTTKPDLALSQIAARFTRHDVKWSRGALSPAA